MLLKLIFWLFRQEQLFLNFQSEKLFSSLRVRRHKSKKSISQINRISSRLLLIQFYFKYDFLILIKKYLLLLSIKTVDLQNMNFRLSSMKMFYTKCFKKTLQNEFLKEFYYRIQWDYLKLFDLKLISDFWMRLTM